MRIANWQSITQNTELEDGTHISRLEELTTAPDEKRNKKKMVLYLGTHKHVPSVHEGLHVRKRMIKDVQLLLTVHTH